MSGSARDLYCQQNFRRFLFVQYEREVSVHTHHTHKAVWTLSAPDSLNVLWQTSHSLSLSSLCVLLCSTSRWLRVNFFWDTSHSYGLCQVWVSMWRFTELCRVYSFPHTRQEYCLRSAMSFKSNMKCIFKSNKTTSASP